MKSFTLIPYFALILLIYGCSGSDTEVGSRYEELNLKWKTQVEANAKENAGIIAMDALVADWLENPQNSTNDDFENKKNLAISNDIAGTERKKFFHIAQPIAEKMKELGHFDPETNHWNNPGADVPVVYYMTTPSISNSISNIEPCIKVWMVYNDAVSAYSNASQAQFKAGNLDQDVLANFPKPTTEEEKRWKNWEFTSSSPLDVLLNIELLKEDLLKRAKLFSEATAKALNLEVPAATNSNTADQQKPQIKCKAESDTVFAGMMYECELSVEHLPAGIKPTFSGALSIRQESPKLTTGRATAPGGFPKGVDFKTQNVQIQAQYTDVDGKAVVLKQDCRYIIARPIATFQPAVGTTLKLNKPQKITIDVKGLGEFYNPKVKSDGAKIETTADKRQFTITPLEKEFEIRVSSRTNGQLIYVDSYKFTAK